MKKYLIFLFIGLSVFLIAGCHFASQIDPVSELKSVPQDQAVVVLGLSWQDQYKDPTDDLEKIVRSSALLTTQQVQANKKLAKPAYDISHLRYYFWNGKQELVIDKFYLDPKGYLDYGVYLLPPGDWKLTKVIGTYRIFDMTYFTSMSADNDRIVSKEYSLSSPSWQLQAGKLYYLGRLDLKYHSQKRIRGLIIERVINEQIMLEGQQWLDDWAKKDAFLPTDLSNQKVTSLVQP